MLLNLLIPARVRALKGRLHARSNSFHALPEVPPGTEPGRYFFSDRFILPFFLSAYPSCHPHSCLFSLISPFHSSHNTIAPFQFTLLIRHHFFSYSVP